MYIIGRVNQGVRRHMRQCLAEWNLTVQEFTTLSVLGSRPGLSNAQLARRALVTPQAMIEILAKLEARGLVRRTADPAHRRILRAELTPAAVELLSTIEPHILSIQDLMLASIPVREQAAATRAMRVAMTNLSNHHERS